MPLKNNIITSNSSVENQKVQALRDIAQVQRLVANNLQQIMSVLQRMEMKRK